jgi:succinoglycan biosynthesis protein ExoA
MKQHMANDSVLYLTVIVPARNEEQFIGDTLGMLAAQDYPSDRFEILVVDGMSTDKTRDVVGQFMAAHPQINLRLLENPGRLSSCARNIGVRAARGKLIAVIDAHVHVPNIQLFRAMERLKEKSGALCLARPAPLLVPSIREGKAYWIAVARGSWLAHSARSYIYSDFEGFVDPQSSGFAYDREVFSRAGYFDESFDAAEDVEFHYRLLAAGIEAYTAPELTINSYPRSTIGGLFNQMVRYGVGRARLVRKHPQAFTWETLLPIAVLMMFLGIGWTAAVAWWLPWPAALNLAGVAHYSALIAGTAIVLALLRGRLLGGPVIAAAIAATHLGLAVGFLNGWFERNRPPERPTESPLGVKAAGRSGPCDRSGQFGPRIAAPSSRGAGSREMITELRP